MGGILGGLIGGIAKGALGGYAKEGERQRRQKEYVDNLITRMHINRLEDFENLSPEAQEAHIAGIEAINPDLKKSGALRAGLGIAKAIAPHIQQAIGPPPIPRSEPIGGAQRPLDIPYNVQDMTPAKLPPPAIAPNAPLRPVPTLETMMAGAGKTEANTTPAERKFYQQELFREQQAERARQDALYYKQQELATALQTERAAGEPEAEVSKMRQSREFPTYAKNQMGGTWSQPIAYENSKGEQFLIGHNGKTGKFFNAETGEIHDTLPPDLKIAPKPRQFARRFFIDDNGAVTSVDPNIPQAQQAQGTGVAPVPGAAGKKYHQPSVTMRYDTPAGPVDVPTPRNEAYAKGRQALKEAMGTGGGTPTPNVLAPLTPTGQKALSDLAPTKALFNKIKASLEDIKDDNTPLENLPQRLAYTGGLATEASKLISQLELAKITGAMPFAKASRNMTWLAQVQQHLGNVRTDSPKLLYSKVSNALENFDEMEKDIRIYHVKGARPNAGLTPPPTAGGEDYSAPYDAMYNGKQVKVRKNLKTGKVQLVQ